MIEIFIALALLQVKHWYFDFANQTQEEIKFKGTYLDWRGMKHSLKHGVGTFIVLLMCSVSVQVAWVAAVMDGLIHYHIDWFKMNYGCKDINDKQFWSDLGLDQMAHQLTYLAIIAIIML